MKKVLEILKANSTITKEIYEKIKKNVNARNVRTNYI